MLISENIDRFVTFNKPTVVYDLDVLEKKIYIIHKLLPSYVKLMYSVKANDNSSILEFISKSDLIYGFEVASIMEYQKVEKYSSNEIGFTGPAFTVNEIQDIYKKGYIYDFDNIYQLLDVESSLKNKDIGIRINMDLSNLESKEKNKKSRFGFKIEDIQTNLFKQFLEKRSFRIKRIHIHNGEKDKEVIKKMVDIISSILAMDIGKNIEEINLGGGWNYLYEKNMLEESLKNFDSFKNLKIIIEPGRLIVNDSGYLVTQVINKQIIDATQHIVLNVSAYNLLSWFPTFPIANTSLNKEKILTCLWGNTCYEEDFFLKNHWMNNLNISDKVIFYPFGAYFKNNSKTLHLLPFPKEVVYRNGDAI